MTKQKKPVAAGNAAEASAADAIHDALMQAAEKVLAGDKRTSKARSSSASTNPSFPKPGGQQTP